MPMTRKDFGETMLKGMGAAAVASSLPSSLAGNAMSKRPPADRPNIVFVCSDQHSYKYAGYMGHPIVQTPNLDRIAGQGVAFTDHYCQNPVCVPGRAALMTGAYASDVGSYCNSTVWDGSHPTWTKLLQDAGYYCRATGKLDMNPDFDMGLDEYETSHGHRTKPDITSLFRRPTIFRYNERNNITGRPRDNRHRDQERTRHAVDFIRSDAPNRTQPWALWVGLTQPHPRFTALEQYYNQYYPDNVDLPEIPDGYLENLHLVFQELRHFKRIATPIPEDRIRKARAGYYGMITELDEYIGQVWDSLEVTGQLDNTLFIYTSDHGESLGEHGLWLKNNLFDVAARVPLVMAGAGIPQGKRVSTPVGHVDVVASILEWAGVKRPKYLRGHSLDGLMSGKKSDHPGFAFSETHSEGNATGSFTIRKGDWKYIHFTWYDGLLFNVQDDPGEFRNRIDDPAAQDVLADLRKTLHSQVDPEEVTVAAFRKQDKMLKDFAANMNDEQLFGLLKGRLGDGQARSMVSKLRGR